MSEDVENGETAGLISQRDRNITFDPKISDVERSTRVGPINVLTPRGQRGDQCSTTGLTFAGTIESKTNTTTADMVSNRCPPPEQKWPFVSTDKNQQERLVINFSKLNQSRDGLT
ncbi:hypothetical protein BaRGS_00012521 [Batillaria attramentaria]|uniref:Uncharacterized protein n=1 Tax=Batillaria attramentaria TaxID=370345 RepID=A0ABD0L9Z2_9CAEN